MNKKILLFIFLVLVAIFVYPSFRSAGVDCMAGCSMSKGLPLPYSIIHDSGITGYDSSPKFFIGYLILDILIWFGVALLVTGVALLVKKGVSFLKSKF